MSSILTDIADDIDTITLAPESSPAVANPAQVSPQPKAAQSTAWLMPACFIAGLLIAATLLALIPVPASLRYASLQGDMTRVADVHERIVANPKPIDIAFIGTSHTWNGIDDATLQSGLAHEDIKLSIANLASSWPGRDLRLLMLKELLQHKKPRLVVIEIDEHEYPFGHGVMPYVGTAEDMLCCRFWLDGQWPKHFALFLKRQAINGFDMLSTPAAKPALPAPVHDNTFGWMPLDDVWKDPVARADSASFKTRVKEAGYRASRWYGMGVVQDMVRLAHEHGADVRFLYLPEYPYAKRDPVVPIDAYTRLAPVLRMPAQIADNPSLWHDKAHVNRRGAAILTASLQTQLAAYLSQAAPIARGDASRPGRPR